MGLIYGEYDAKAEGLLLGGPSLHNCMSCHGPDAQTFERATAAELSHSISKTRIPSCSRRAWSCDGPALHSKIRSFNTSTTSAGKA